MASLKSYLAKLEARLSGLSPNAQQAVMEELRGHLEDRVAALRAGGLEKEASMSEAIERFGEAGEIGDALRDVHGRGSWDEALKGMVPFMLQPIFLIFGSAIAALVKYLHLTGPVLPVSVFLVAIGSAAVFAVLTFSGAFLTVLGVGWVKGFPRWSYPYGGLVLAFTSVVVADRLDLWIIFNRYARWIPLLVMAAIALLLGRLWRPLRSLYKGVWHDWTRLSFGLYGILPLALAIAFDEVRGPYEAPCLAASSVILAVGALAYIRSARTSQRALALLTGMTLSWAVATAFLAIYWDGRQEPWMWKPGHWYETARWMVKDWVVLAALMFAPALLGLLRRSVKFIRTA